MRAGRLDHQIIIKTPVITRNDFGEDISTLTEVATVPAEVRQVNGNERFISQQIIAKVSALFMIRWMEGITPKNVIIHDGREYNVLSSLEIGRREGLAIAAEARAE